MGKLIDLTGRKFARLTVLERDVSAGPATGGKRVKWRCRCDCGSVISAVGKNLILGNTRSCGCLKLDALVARSTTHGRSQDRVYRIWSSMLARCKYPSHDTYRFYGAKGVTVCERWNEFNNFLADMGEPGEGMTIDRKDASGNYEPSNCRWSTMAEQHNNLRKSYDWHGRRLSLAAIARDVDVPRTSLAKLVNGKGMSIEDAVAHATAHRQSPPRS